MSAAVSWTADADAGSKRASWAPQAGNARLQFDSMLVPASRGLPSFECGQLASSYSLDTGQALPEGPPGAAIERFAVQRSLARYHVVSEIHQAAAGQLTRGYIAGSRFRYVRVSAMLTSLRTRRYAFPAYVLAYRYEGEVFRAIVSGQDARWVFGSLPVSYRRLIWTIILIGIALMVFVAWLLSAGIGMILLLGITG